MTPMERSDSAASLATYPPGLTDANYASMSEEELRDEVRRLREALRSTEESIQAVKRETSGTRHMTEEYKSTHARQRSDLEASIRALEEETATLHDKANSSWMAARRAQMSVRQSKDKGKDRLSELADRRRRLSQENTRLRKQAVVVRAQLRNCRMEKQRSGWAAGPQPTASPPSSLTFGPKQVPKEDRAPRSLEEEIHVHIRNLEQASNSKSGLLDIPPSSSALASEDQSVNAQDTECPF